MSHEHRLFTIRPSAMTGFRWAANLSGGSIPAQDVVLTSLMFVIFFFLCVSTDVYTVSELFGIDVVWPLVPLCRLPRH